MNISAYGAMAAALAFSAALQAEPALLSSEEAFPLTVISSSAQEAELSWKMPPNYYLYRHKIEVRQGSQPVALQLPPAETLHDDNYGRVQVYYQQLQLHIPTQASQQYQVTWQGCAQDRVCYPPQSITFQTDAGGLVSMQNQGHAGKRLLDLAGSGAQQNGALAPRAGAIDAAAEAQPSAAAGPAAQDPVWSAALAQSSLLYGLLLFFGLGLLLAFTPCSLPMLPILTSLIVRDSKGMKAWMIALTFVCSMALVYSVLGLIASSAGLNFQRWLQQPSTLIAFSLLFVVFALNLFGLFEIKLPRALVQRLDRVQSVQKGGSLAGAAVMGMISALLVGPCMTAPLAGALLFISQTQSQWHTPSIRRPSGTQPRRAAVRAARLP